MDLLFHQGALGDWVLTFPILRGWGPLTVVTAGSKARLASRLVEGVEACDIEQPCLTCLHAEHGHVEVGDAWRARLAGAARIVSFVSSGSDTWARNVRTLAPEAHLAFVDPRPSGDQEHVADGWVRRLREQSIEIELVTATRRDGSGPLVIHPGSGGRDKCWPLERFEQLIAALPAPPRIALGPVEAERWPEATLRRWRDELGAVVADALDELVDLLADASSYLGNDSGPTHLAASMGVPTIAMFGPTCPRTWSPRGPSVTLLAPPHPGEMTWLELPQVLKALGANPG